MNAVLAESREELQRRVMVLEQQLERQQGEAELVRRDLERLRGVLMAGREGSLSWKAVEDITLERDRMREQRDEAIALVERLRAEVDRLKGTA